jgi:hypothetical protein
MKKKIITFKQALAKDAADLAAFEKRSREKQLVFEDVVRAIRRGRKNMKIGHRRDVYN